MARAVTCKGRMRPVLVVAVTVAVLVGGFFYAAINRLCEDTVVDW
jgi:hypothetical protein